MAADVGDVIVQFMYIIIATVLAGVASALGFMIKTSGRISRLEEQTNNGVDAIKKVQDDIRDNTKLTMDTARAISGIAPAVAQNTKTVSRYMPMVDSLERKVFEIGYVVKHLRTTINEVRIKQGLQPIKYPQFDPSHEPVPKGPPAPEEDDDESASGSPL